MEMVCEDFNFHLPLNDLFVISHSINILNIFVEFPRLIPILFSRFSKRWESRIIPDVSGVASATNAWTAFRSPSTSTIKSTASTITIECSPPNAPVVEKVKRNKSTLFWTIILKTFYSRNHSGGRNGRDRPGRVDGQRFPRRLLHVRRMRHAIDRRTRQKVLSSKGEAIVPLMSYFKFNVSLWSFTGTAFPGQLSVHGLDRYFHFVSRRAGYSVVICFKITSQVLYNC